MRAIALNIVLTALFLTGAALMPSNADACCCTLVVNCTVTPAGASCESDWVCY